MRTAAARPSTFQTQIITAMNAAVKIIAACQSILTRYLPPDGIREGRCIHELLEILDGPEAVALTMQPASTVTQLQEAQAAMVKRREIARSFFAEPPLKNVSGAPDMASPDVRASIAAGDELTRLREELAERLQREKSLISHAESADRRMEEQSRIIADLQRRLHRAEEKVKGVALALAEV